MNLSEITSVRQSFRVAQRILCRSRGWHRDLQQRFTLSPAVEAALDVCRPADWQQLLLEWPHAAEMDKTRIAYTRDERAGLDNRQTVTSMGKYLTRHFPDMRDHVVRDLVARFGTLSRFVLYDKMIDMVHVVQNGPRSCMQWDEEEVDRHGYHPYEVYDPAFGWKMAARYDGASINGRALVMDRPADNAKYFVRTYRRNNNGYSPADEELAEWLKSQGFEYRYSWEGEKIAHITKRGRWDEEVVAPYIDGHAQAAELDGKHVDGVYKRFMRITQRGEFSCNNTDGLAEFASRCTCEDCDARVNEDDICSVGYDGDRSVCESCRDDNYTHVRGRRNCEYYVPNDEAVEVDGEYYDERYLSQHEIVQLENGDHVHMDNACHVESLNEWHHIDDCVQVGDDGGYELESDCVQLANGDWCLESEAWQCAESEGWYSNDDDDMQIEVDGETYHRDHAPEPAQQDLPLEQPTETI